MIHTLVSFHRRRTSFLPLHFPARRETSSSPSPIPAKECTVDPPMLHAFWTGVTGAREGQLGLREEAKGVRDAPAMPVEAVTPTAVGSRYFLRSAAMSSRRRTDFPVPASEGGT